MSPDLAEHPNVALVRRLYDAMAARDVEALMAMFGEDVVVEQTEELPWGGHFTGHDGLGTFFLTLIGTITSQVTISTIFAAGDVVVQVGRTAGTVNATGRPFDVDEVHLLTVRDGKVVRFEAHIDTPAMLAALAEG